jgi:1A family penicillin-binding protein
MLAQLRHRRLLIVLAAISIFILASGLALYCWLLVDLPSWENLDRYTTTPSNKVYDRNGRLLYEMPPPHGGSHSPLSLDQVPGALIQATLAVEDANFYEHPGVDPKAIVRAFWLNLREGEVVSGGSTITQQLARTLLLKPEERQERTLRRKLREAILAWQLSQRYSKDEILELYLNESYYGNMAYGVAAAARTYFGKSVSDLDLAECAMLAGLPQAPTYYNPLENLAQAKERQAIVLDLMVKHNSITLAESKLAKDEKLYFAPAPFPIEAPHFVMYVRGSLEEELGLERLEQGGLNIYTTLDLDMNRTAQDIIQLRLARLADCYGLPTGCPEGGHNVRNAALIALDPRTGEVLAMVGSPDYFSARIDGAVNGTTALRQPGSSIKPVTYAAAFESGELTPATMMLDVRTAFVTKEGDPYVPINYDLQYGGPIRLREALASSSNLIAVKVLESIGIEAMTGMARRLGITTFDDSNRFGLAIALGGGEVRLLELTAAYGAFANGGHVVHPVAVQRVEDPNGTVIWMSDAGVGDRVLDERIGFLISDILSDNIARMPGFGEDSLLRLSRPAAVKTGTTTDFRDNWTVGYTPDLVVGVWAGNADNEPMFEISGVSGAAPIWHDFMEMILKDQSVLQFKRPDGLVEVEVCALSGLLPEPDCPHRVTELFVTGTEPTAYCPMHERLQIDVATGLRASADTPPDRTVEQTFVIYPPEAREWARIRGIPEPPPLPGETLAYEPAVSNPISDAYPLVMAEPDFGASFLIDPTLPRDAQRIAVSVRLGRVTGLSQVTLFADGQVLALLKAPPYRAFWRIEEGEHVFWAEGVGNDGKTVKSNEVKIRVKSKE